MTKEKQKLDKIIELYNSGIEENIKLAIETANSIFGINASELEYMVTIRSNNLITCRIKEDKKQVEVLGIKHIVSRETTIKIKHNSSLPIFLKRLFTPTVIEN
jgi:hypothetical protein